MTTNLISDSPVPHKFQLLTAPSLVYGTQFHSKIIAGLKIVLLLICSHNFYGISTAGLYNTSVWCKWTNKHKDCDACGLDEIILWVLKEMPNENNNSTVRYM